jgi:hypothetical protein
MLNQFLEYYLTHASQEVVFVYNLLALSVAAKMPTSTNVRFAKQGLGPWSNVPL